MGARRQVTPSLFLRFVPVSAGTQRGQKGILYRLELEVQLLAA